MARLTLALVLTVLVVSASSRGQRGFHTRFAFSMFGGRSYSAEEQAAVQVLGTSDGWTCKASPIELLEHPPAPGGAKQAASRTANIICTDVSGASATISASCNVAAAERSGSSVQLKSSKSQKGFPVAVHIECVTD